MGSFTITNNVALRQLYTGNTGLLGSDARKTSSSSKLASADAQALRKGLSILSRIDKDDVSSSQESSFYDKVRAFSDAYNNAIQSGSSSQNASISKLAKKMKSLSAENSSKLSACGISMDANGYMKVSDTKVKEITGKTYDEVFGKGSDYSKKLSSLARQMAGHVDTTA